MAIKEEQVIEDVQPDAFVARANEYAGVIEKNLRLVVGGVGALLAVGVVYSFVSSQGTRTASAETAKLTKALQVYDEAIDPQKTATSSTGAVPAKLTEALGELEKLGQSKGAVGTLAKLYAADAARRAKDPAKAEAMFRAFIGESRESDALRFLAHEGLGYVLEDQGKLDDAKAEFVKLGQVQGQAFADLSLKHQARIAEAKGDKDTAKSLYRELLDKHAESKLRDFAEQRLANLE
jgi:predicted negative regulator of RcsB-dependent stress response